MLAPAFVRPLLAPFTLAPMRHVANKRPRIILNRSDAGKRSYPLVDIILAQIWHSTLATALPSYLSR